MLKYIIVASFGLTGTLFYLSKPSSLEQKAAAPLGVPDVEAEPSKPAPGRKKPLHVASVPAAPAENPKYAALLPIGDQDQAVSSRRNRPRDDFYEKYVHATVRSCYDELVKRRLMIHKEREGDAELSFDGDLQIIASFNQNQVESLRSRSSEVRDDTFHNCIETGARNWIFPPAISSQGQWTYKQRVSFDVNYRYDCKDSSLRIRGSEGVPTVGAGNCF